MNNWITDDDHTRLGDLSLWAAGHELIAVPAGYHLTSPLLRCLYVRVYRLYKNRSIKRPLWDQPPLHVCTTAAAAAARYADGHVTAIGLVFELSVAKSRLSPSLSLSLCSFFCVSSISTAFYIAGWPERARRKREREREEGGGVNMRKRRAGETRILTIQQGGKIQYGRDVGEDEQVAPSGAR